MNLIRFFVDHNHKTCSVSFGLPFVFEPLNKCPLIMDGKEVVAVGMTPHTVEKTIAVDYDNRSKADAIISRYYYNTPAMIENLLTIK